MKEFKGRVLAAGNWKGEAVVSRQGVNTLATFQKSALKNAKEVIVSDQNNPGYFREKYHGKSTVPPDYDRFDDGRSRHSDNLRHENQSRRFFIQRAYRQLGCKRYCACKDLGEQRRDRHRSARGRISEVGSNGRYGGNQGRRQCDRRLTGSV